MFLMSFVRGFKFQKAHGPGRENFESPAGRAGPEILETMVLTQKATFLVKNGTI